MQEVRNEQQTQDCTQWGLTALLLWDDSRILTRAQGGKAKLPSYQAGCGGRVPSCSPLDPRGLARLVQH